MLIEVDRHSGVPAYRQIMDQVRFQAASGALPPGSELPSTRALAAETGLNPMTISKAYGLLEREGVVERRPGRALVIRKAKARDLSQQRIAELRRSLDEAVRVARQLGVDEQEALALFARMLEEGASTRRKTDGSRV